MPSHANALHASRYIPIVLISSGMRMDRSSGSQWAHTNMISGNMFAKSSAFQWFLFAWKRFRNRTASSTSIFRTKNSVIVKTSPHVTCVITAIMMNAHICGHRFSTEISLFSARPIAIVGWPLVSQLISERQCLGNAYSLFQSNGTEKFGVTTKNAQKVVFGPTHQVSSVKKSYGLFNLYLLCHIKWKGLGPPWWQEWVHLMTKHINKSDQKGRFWHNKAPCMSVLNKCVQSLSTFYA